MSESSVLDTGVLIGFCIQLDQHHEECRKYITGNSWDMIVPPCVDDEFSDVEEKIRNDLAEEIGEHREDLQKEMKNKENFNRSDLRYIRNNLLPDDPTEWRAWTFLRKYYDNLISSRVEVDKLEVVYDLNDFEIEVYEDAASDIGGWKSHVKIWTKGVDEYTSIRSNLLLDENDGKDLDVCIQAHHIAENGGASKTYLATPNTTDFIDKCDGESESRKDNIKRLTSIDEIHDVAGPLIP